MRIKRAVEIAMSNYEGISGSCVFSYEGKIAYATENMQISNDFIGILQAWNASTQNFSIKKIPFISALSTPNGFVAINPDGATSFICGTGKGVWFVAVFAPMDTDKNGILRECIQVAKSLEKSVSVLDI